MEDSILTSTKHILNISEEDTAFDLDIATHINTALSAANQLGIGDPASMFIEDDAKTWSDLGVPAVQMHMLKTYVFLRVRVLFDPPQTSFALSAQQEQLKEYEWRLSTFREYALEES